MRTCYVDREHNAIADLVKPGELTEHWTITRINVPKEHRGKGYGTALLARILADADRDNVFLQLEISPSDGLNYGALYAWYKRHGFMRYETGYMRRRPRRGLKECISSRGIRHWAFLDGEATFCGKWTPRGVEPDDDREIRDCINCARVRLGMYVHNVVLGPNPNLKGGEQHEEGQDVPDG